MSRIAITSDTDQQNEDCGQMSAWYLFSAMGFYPGTPSFLSAQNEAVADADTIVDPASATYIIGSPFFDFLSLSLPGAPGPISVKAPGASKGFKYIKSLTINGIPHHSFVLQHADVANGAELVFEMSDTPQSWPNGDAHRE